MDTAQEGFKLLLRDRIAPALRDLGFKGSGQTYALTNDACWALLGFQRSTASDARELRFTINLSFVSKVAWESARVQRTFLPARPLANVVYGEQSRWERIGSLLPQCMDKWWRVTATPAPSIAAEVVDPVRDFGLPWMRTQIEQLTIAGGTKEGS